MFSIQGGELIMWRWFVVAIFSVCAQLSAQSITGVCDIQFQDNDPASALSYLRQERQNLSSACIVRAMHVIGLNKYQKAISTLIEYLDFEIPVAAVIRHSQGPTNGICPAADALARFGHASIASLRSTLADPDASQATLDNAAKVLFAVSDDKPDVIRDIVKAARACHSQQTADSLLKLASAMPSYCSSAVRDACKRALNDE